MEKMKAFLLALALFLLTVTGIHIAAGRGVNTDPVFYSGWTDEAKSLSYVGLTLNMQTNMIPVFGSSEFQHGMDTSFHPAAVFRGSDFHPMLIGAGYYQSLSHSVTLAAIEKSLSCRKAVLLLSPQWFRKTGVLPQAYLSRFSEILYGKMLENDALSEKTKDYISDRTCLLLQKDSQTLARAAKRKASVDGNVLPWYEAFLERLWDSFLTEKDSVTIAFRQKTAKTRLEKEESARPSQEGGQSVDAAAGSPDWEALKKAAIAAGDAENQNPFYIDDKAYQRLKPYLPGKKGMNASAKGGYQYGPEFEDLSCFLSVCEETGIEPMLVILPVNGYYYDYTEFPKTAREAYYTKIRQIASQYQVRTADFSDQEYTRYFFEDRVHLGKIGWVMVNEAIYQFFKE